MTGAELFSGLSVSTDEIRASPGAMRACLRELAERGNGIWAGPLEELVDALAMVARVDLCLARLVEGHADGLRILAEADHPAHEGVYGVWASRSVGTGVAVTRRDSVHRLAGTLRFASGVDLIDRVLVPAYLHHEQHILVDLRADAVSADYASWNSAGMDASRSFTVSVDTQAPEADLVGPVGFYLGRPGFAMGGLCVAAVWAGGAQQVVDLVTTGLRDFDPTPHQLRRVGVMEQAVWQARAALASALDRLPDLDEAQVAREISMARTAVVTGCDDVLAEAACVVGPAGLSGSARLARAVADLAIYVRQHHLDHELTRLGEHTLTVHQVAAP